jgi:hypothetical protein
MSLPPVTRSACETVVARQAKLATSPGNKAGRSNVLYGAVTDEHRVLRIDLRGPQGGSEILDLLSCVATA